MGLAIRLMAWGMVGLAVLVPAATRAQPQAVANTELPATLQAALGDARSPMLTDLSALERGQLTAIYRTGGWTGLWVDGSRRPHADAREALAQLEGAAREGLDPRHYRAARLRDEAAALDAAASTPAVASVVSFDVGLSAGIVGYLRDLHMGRVDPRAIGFRMTTGRDEHDFPALLRSALDAHRIAEAAGDLVPQFALYRGLRGALARYRDLAAGPSFDLPAPAGRSLHPGEEYVALPDLRRRLLALGDWPKEAFTAVAAAVYEGPYVEAVRGFQSRHGLDADGVLGDRTLEALRAPLAQRVRQIELGLERLRWLPHIGKGRLLAVNIPMFRLWAWDSMVPGDMPAFDSRVIVGRALDTETPVFVEEMRHLIFRPYWNVPSGILRNEILPALARDPGYLARERMEIVDGPGDDAPLVDVTTESIDLLRQGRLRVRQRPGPTNSLGLVKFVFPNDENVYLHGTPTTALFARSRRDFSHGCVRVEDPVALADWALAGQDGWTRERILAAMNGDRPVRVTLAQPVPVILFYITAAVMPEDGTVHFAEDIYGHDTRLERALALRESNR